MAETLAYSLDELVASVNAWSAERGFTPANGQSADQLSARTLRYYRTMGLLAAPNPGGGYGEMHRLQLSAIRVLQAHGLPLRRIQTLLYGRSIAELRKVLEKGAAAVPTQPISPALNGAEDWKIAPVDDSVWLILRHGRILTPNQLTRIAAILNTPDESLELQLERKS